MGGWIVFTLESGHFDLCINLFCFSVSKEAFSKFRRTTALSEMSDFYIRFNNSSHQMTYGGFIAACVRGFVTLCVCMSNSVCNMLPLTKLFWGDKHANVAANTGNSPKPPATGFIVNAGLVLHVALEIMHNKNECWLFVVRGHFLALIPEQVKVIG